MVRNGQKWPEMTVFQPFFMVFCTFRSDNWCRARADSRRHGSPNEFGTRLDPAYWAKSTPAASLKSRAGVFGLQVPLALVGRGLEDIEKREDCVKWVFSVYLCVFCDDFPK